MNEEKTDMVCIEAHIYLITVNGTKLVNVDDLIYLD